MTSSPTNPSSVVLVVDDDAAGRIMVRAALEQSGFTVFEAEDGDAAITLFASERLDIMLLDVMMPRMNGFQTCTAIRQLNGGQYIPIVMMTGLEDVESINEAFEVGATDFITKPLNYSILTHRVRYMLRAAATARELRGSEARLEHAQDMAKLGHWEWYVDTGLFVCSQRVEELFGVRDRSVIRGWAALLKNVHEDDRSAVETTMTKSLKMGRKSTCDYRILGEDGEVRYIHQEAMPINRDKYRARCITGTVQDVSARKRAEEEAHQLAYFDTITGLPNRRLMNQELARSLEIAKRHQRIICVLSIDLDNFNRINDTLGYERGNRVLKEVADRLLKCVRSSDMVSVEEYVKARAGDTIARIGGDEFVIVLTEVRSAEDAALVSRRIRERLAMPIAVKDGEIVLTCSTGISVYPVDSDNAESLITNAEAAMNHAKSGGRDRYQFYTASMNARAFERLSLETNLRKAVQQGQFELYFQPKNDTRTARTVGAEALARWNHPDLGIVSPLDFIPVAEETGLIIPLGEWIIREACRWAKRWSESDLPRLTIAVNISAAQFQADGLIDCIRSTIEEFHLDPEYLELEITESLLMQDVDKTIKSLRELEAIGIPLWIDDFGTGYSSLSYLKRLPISGLKIDKSFVREMDSDDDDASIVSAVIALACSLGLGVIAEGVETKTQLELLAAQGCGIAQGYHFSVPLPAAAFETWVRNQAAGSMRK